MKIMAWIAVVTIGGFLMAPAAGASEKSGLAPWKQENYSYAYWLNGWRKNADDTSPDILCFETGNYGMTLNVGDFSKMRFGLLNDNAGYTQALQSGAQRINELPPAALEIEVEVNGRVYRAAACQAGLDRGPKRLQSARLWESGKLVQHFDFAGLVFKDNTGRELPSYGMLDIVAWPDALTLNVELAPETSAWTDARFSIRLNDWHIEKQVPGEWAVGNNNRLSLSCNLNDRQKANDGIVLKVTAAQQKSVPVVFDERYNSHVAKIKSPPRDWKSGYTDIRNYDEFDITIENEGDGNTYAPFLLDLTNPANITGLCPILCDASGTPTGIPVQLSKNWHHVGLGSYLRAYALIPAQPGTSKYKLRIAYGFYGTLPSASHAQLSLVGYGNDGNSGNNGRWEQLAIGCWGETICFDMDMSCVDVTITDVRMLMARNGREGKKWTWTDAGWGGDWLNLRDDLDQKLYCTELKTAYNAHGPCLTEVQYEGCYGTDRQIDSKTTVRTLRTDDYARTFQTFSYTFNQPVSATNGWLFKMGRTPGYVTPQLAYGNGKGLIREHQIPNTLKRNETHLEPTTLTGPAPWWIAQPGAHHHPVTYHQNRGRENYATGSRAIIIRSYQAIINGQTNTNPTISAPVCQVHTDGSPNLDLLLMPPPGITQFNPGDTIDFDVEVITPHREADDYYGPNKTYRNHLAKHPRSWKTVYREALGNNLKPEVEGGTVKHPYPLIIEVTNQETVQFKINEGIGAVPVRFDGLKTPNHSLYQVVNGKQIKLDQSVHGNDYWQTDYNPESDTYSLTVNLPLDGLRTSEWILRTE